MNEQQYNKILALVKKGKSITAACMELNISWGVYQRTVTDEQREELKANKVYKTIGYGKGQEVEEKECRMCGDIKPVSDFHYKASRCKECVKKKGNKSVDRSDEKLKALSEEVRWKNARRIKGYKFEGVVPPPKEIGLYKYWE